MERAVNFRITSGMFSALVAGCTLLGAAGCAEEADQVETTQSAVVTWTNLQLVNGWQSFGAGYTPRSPSSTAP